MAFRFFNFAVKSKEEMKAKYFGVIFLLLLTVACGRNEYSVTTSDGQKLEGPAAYNDYLVAEQNRIIRQFSELNKAYESYSRDEIERARAALLNEIDEVIAAVEDLPPYEGDTELRDAALEMFQYYRQLAEKELKEIGDLLSKGENQITESDIDEMDRLYKRFRKEIKSYEINFADAQRAFANKYGMKIKSKEKDSLS